MTEAEWLASEDPAAMLSYWCNRQASAERPIFPSKDDRKLRLVVHAWVKLTSPPDHPKNSHDLWLENGLKNPKLEDMGYTQARLWASSRPEQMRTQRAALFREVAGNPFRPATLPPAWTCRECGIPTGPPAAGYYCVKCGADEARCRPCPWLTPTVLSLAQTTYDEQRGPCPCVYARQYGPDCQRCHGTGNEGTLDPARLAVLSDALEEAGGDDAELLMHLRGWDMTHARTYIRQSSRPLIHVRGCWALDLLLGKV